jgi:hypothetical protein
MIHSINRKHLKAKGRPVSKYLSTNLPDFNVQEIDGEEVLINDGAVESWRGIQETSKALDESKAFAERLKTYRTLVLMCRANCMELLTRYTTNSTKPPERSATCDQTPLYMIRNLYMHGADVTNDAAMCLMIEKSQQHDGLAERWWTHFEAVYYLPPSTAVKLLKYSRLEKALNIHCNLRVFEFWKNAMTRLRTNKTGQLGLTWRILDRAYLLVEGRPWARRTLFHDMGDETNRHLGLTGPTVRQWYDQDPRIGPGQIPPKLALAEERVDKMMRSLVPGGRDLPVWPDDETLEAAMEEEGSLSRMLSLLKIPTASE